MEIEYKVVARTESKVFEEKSLEIIYSPKFFEAEGKRLSMEFELPRKYLSKMQFEVTQSGRTNKKRAWSNFSIIKISRS